MDKKPTQISFNFYKFFQLSRDAITDADTVDEVVKKCRINHFDSKNHKNVKNMKNLTADLHTRLSHCVAHEYNVTNLILMFHYNDAYTMHCSITILN